MAKIYVSLFILYRVLKLQNANMSNNFQRQDLKESIEVLLIEV